MADAVLDASAVLAVLNGEPGAHLVTEVLPNAVVSAVNLSEVVAKLASAGAPGEEIKEAIQALRLEVLPFDQEQAHDAGLLRPLTRSAGLSLGDRACLSLARRLGLPALTADHTWEQLHVAEVRTIR
ncbi:MAG: type II toxin-antitoxin system VapC family toxin [Chloroflexi bacterium]|nr:type II toxin-antitoxin system VapC family toxin [Chloroflexota bacterium]